MSFQISHVLNFHNSSPIDTYGTKSIIKGFLNYPSHTASVTIVFV